MDVAWVGAQEGAEDEEGFARAVGWGVAGGISSVDASLIFSRSQSEVKVGIPTTAPP